MDKVLITGEIYQFTEDDMSHHAPGKLLIWPLETKFGYFLFPPHAPSRGTSFPHPALDGKSHPSLPNRGGNAIPIHGGGKGKPGTVPTGAVSDPDAESPTGLEVLAAEGEGDKADDSLVKQSWYIYAHPPLYT